MTRSHLPGGALAALSLFLLGCLPRAARASDPATEVEKIIGAQVARSLRDQSGVDNDPLLLPWIQEIGARVAAPSPRQNLRYRFTILDSSTANAFAAPGGYIFVTRGLLDVVESDDEVASILAHESGHVARRHAMQQIGANVLFLALMTALHGGKYDKVRIGANIFNVLRTLEKSREMEAQADEVGIGFAAQAGYDPGGLVHFFEGLDRREPSRIEQCLATHPTPSRRLRDARANPLVARVDGAERQATARGYARRGLPVEAEKALRGDDPLALPPVPPLPLLAPFVLEDRESVVAHAHELEHALGPVFQAEHIGSMLQEVLLINSQPADPRWDFLAAHAYAVQSEVDDIFARTVRVARVAPPTFDALARYSIRPGGDTFAIEGALGRGEIRQALDAANGAPAPLVRASRAVAVVIADLNNRFYRPHGAAAWTRFGVMEGLLRYAESELSRADRASGRAWRLLSLARVRRYEARLTELVPDGDPTARARWYDLAQRRFGAAFPNSGATGDATVRAALSVELRASAAGVEQGRDTTWAEWILKKKGSPENVATAMRLLTLDLERETAADDKQRTIQAH